LSALRVAICDDEPLAVERLERMLRGLDSVEVGQTFLNGEDLLSRFDGADVLLLDVQMPKLDGFDVVEALSKRDWADGQEAPLLICVTAHSQFAVDAFDFGAVDFLTKPVRLSRLELALKRALQVLDNRDAKRRLSEASEQLASMKAGDVGPGEEPHLWLRKGSSKVRVELARIDWISAEGECVRFHSGEDSFLERRSISDVARQLKSSGFARVHRTAVVNRASIEAVDRNRWGSLRLRLRSGAELRVSRSFQAAVKDISSA
jgi:DNA-binding LytR/AlgR family response regulator